METQSHSLASNRPSAESARVLLYVLHSGRLFGTERMAISTLQQLSDQFDNRLLAPAGEAVDYAQTQNIAAQAFAGKWQLLCKMAKIFFRSRQVTLVATGISHSFVGIFLAFLFGVRLRHIHIVHGGTDERQSYGRKKWLRWFSIDFIAVSEFVRQRLIAHAVPVKKITVIENFLLTHPTQARRAQFDAPIQRAILVSRLDPIKRVDLLLDALRLNPTPGDFEVSVLGTGWDEQSLRLNALNAHLPVQFKGYCKDVPADLALSDLLIHTCPEEPFGLVILEAMAAGIPVLVPNAGGPCGYIRDGENGFIYRANDAAHLASRLLEIRQMPASRLNQVVACASLMLRERFSPATRIEDYRRLLKGGKS